MTQEIEQPFGYFYCDLSAQNLAQLEALTVVYGRLAVIADALRRGYTYRQQGEEARATSWQGLADWEEKKLPQWARWTQPEPGGTHAIPSTQ